MSATMIWTQEVTTTTPPWLATGFWSKDSPEAGVKPILPVTGRQSIGLARLTGSRYRLLQPYLLLEMERAENGRVLVWEERSGVYGAGCNEAEAVQDFQSMLEEMYEQLSEAESSISHALYERLTYLRSIIAPY